ncbi:MAG: tetratricopeptide repeat protein [Prevotella sp.]|nr:tetratricopeptide repeat protein [Prevotella sp.]
MNPLFDRCERLLAHILQEKNLGYAIRELLQIRLAEPLLVDSQEMDNLERDYGLMCDYMLQGYRDSQRETMYLHLLRKAYRLAHNSLLRMQRASANGSIAAAYGRTRKLDMSHDAIKRGLESFVQDQAILSLNPDDEEQKGKEIHRRHAIFMKNLFDSLVASLTWSDGEAEFFTQTVLSPTIDVMDARHIVSAITLSLFNALDVNKLQALATVYQQGHDEALRQRALVGFALSLTRQDFSIFPKLATIVSNLCSDDETCKQLLELQIQVFYCMNTDNDSKEIQKNIMPNIIKNNNFRITRFGIEEKEEDPLQDILHPDESEKAMEELEKSFQKMKAMQQAGADIYYGGFSQMKNFPFFNTLSNWFVPFYTENPELENVTQVFADTRMLQLLLDIGPFCDSDKYSFSFAMSSVINRLPNNMREMLNSEEAISNYSSEAELSSPAYIRRMYLQDLYRFFRVCRSKGDFPNPFDYSTSMERFFFTNPIFADTPLRNQFAKLDRFLLKRKEYAALKEMLFSYEETDNVDYLLMRAQLTMQYLGNDALAESYYNQILEKEPNHEKALRGYAQACFNQEKFVEAEEAYGRLVELFPDNRHYTLSHSIAQINNHHVDEGVKTLYRLDYENPDDMQVKRALGWGLMSKGDHEQAVSVYGRVLSSDAVVPSDYLNMGYAYWLKGDVAQARDHFRQFLSSRQNGDNSANDSHDLSVMFKEDKALLEANGIGEVERAIMEDIVLS